MLSDGNVMQLPSNDMVAATSGTSRHATVNRIVHCTLSSGLRFCEMTISQTLCIPSRFKIESGPEGSEEDYFLGGKRVINKERTISSTRMTTYILDLMVEWYSGGHVTTAKLPPAWGHTVSGQ